MEALLQYQDALLRPVKNQFRRFLHNEIDWGSRMIGIKGPRGSGKTTLMLQYFKFDLGTPSEALYLTADHSWFYDHTLLDTAAEWYKNGGRILFIDEVHKYPRWSRELKNIYDGYPDLRVVFSASSALDIYRGESDLSRRVISYNLPGLSFREYLILNNTIEFSPITLEEIVQSHRRISLDITSQFHPLPIFKDYLQYGYLPIILEGKDSYLPKISQIINTVVDSDLAYIQSYNAGTAAKVKKLLAIIAQSVPFKPNISSLARKLEISRESLYNYLSQLESGHLLNTLKAEGKSISTLQKPDKIYLENTNWAYALTANPDPGNLRETFALNQLLHGKLNVNLPAKGDFVINKELYMEVGGKNKGQQQVKNYKHHIVAADGIETGFGKKFPLWLLGFLY